MAVTVMIGVRFIGDAFIEVDLGTLTDDPEPTVTPDLLEQAYAFAQAQVQRDLENMNADDVQIEELIASQTF